MPRKINQSLAEVAALRAAAAERAAAKRLLQRTERQENRARTIQIQLVGAGAAGTGKAPVKISSYLKEGYEVLESDPRHLVKHEEKSTQYILNYKQYLRETK
jgi:hypothetical protein